MERYYATRKYEIWYLRQEIRGERQGISDHRNIPTRGHMGSEDKDIGTCGDGELVKLRVNKIGVGEIGDSWDRGLVKTWFCEIGLSCSQKMMSSRDGGIGEWWNREIDSWWDRVLVSLRVNKIGVGQIDCWWDRELVRSEGGGIGR